MSLLRTLKIVQKLNNKKKVSIENITVGRYLITCERTHMGQLFRRGQLTDVLANDSKIKNCPSACVDNYLGNNLIRRRLSNISNQENKKKLCSFPKLRVKSCLCCKFSFHSILWENKVKRLLRMKRYID